VNCPLLRYYAASSGNSLPTFRDNLSVLSSSVNYLYSLRNSQEERSSHLLRGGSLKSGISLLFPTVQYIRLILCMLIQS